MCIENAIWFFFVRKKKRCFRRLLPPPVTIPPGFTGHLTAHHCHTASCHGQRRVPPLTARFDLSSAVSVSDPVPSADFHRQRQSIVHKALFSCAVLRRSFPHPATDPQNTVADPSPALATLSTGLMSLSRRQPQQNPATVYLISRSDLHGEPPRLPCTPRPLSSPPSVRQGELSTIAAHSDG